MVADSKAGIDWHLMRARFEAGETISQLSKASSVPISRQAILKRGRKEGWAGIGYPEGEGPPQEVESQEGPVQQNELVVAPSRALGQRTSETKAVILASVSNGVTSRLAAQKVGLKVEELAAWMGADPEFALRFGEAQAIWAEKQIGHIDSAAQRGDWRASQHLLAKNDATRDEWGDKSSGAEGLQININIQRAETPPDESEIIDVTPEQVGVR